MSYKTQDFVQDAQPTATSIGDHWITSDGWVRICYQVTAPQLWAILATPTTAGSSVRIGALTQTVTRAQFTDGGATVGTFTLTGVVPAGAILQPMRCLVVLGFTGDTSATLQVGDGSDVDRFNTGTPSIFTTAATGVDMGIVSGIKVLTAAVSPVLTVTSTADFTNVAAGSITLTLPFIVTA